MAKLGRLSFFVVISKTGNNGNDEHSDLDKIVPCYVFQNTTSPHFIVEEGKKDGASSKWEEATATVMVSLRAFAEIIIAFLWGKVKIETQIVWRFCSTLQK